MSYSTPKAVRNALAPGSWTDSEPSPLPSTGTAADLSNDKLQDAIDEADATINTYIGGRYVTPVAAVPDSDPAAYPHPIDFISRDIAGYLATLTNRKNQNLEPTDPVQLRYNAAMAVLLSVRDKGGVLPIPPLGGDTPGGSSGIGRPVNPYNGSFFSDGGGLDLDGPAWPRGAPQDRDGHWIPWPV